jgi:protein-L-isoaspartate(D-aspartate) O-methyltransferase
MEEQLKINKDKLISDLINWGYLKTAEIIKAFQNIDRKDFILQEEKEMAYIDSALSIGFGQTISQPAVVAFMLEKLQPQAGNVVLDIGSGSGWTTALLAEIVGEKGRVIAIETIPELRKFGEENASKYNFVQKKVVQFICGDGKKGYPIEVPYDRILVSASAENINKSWKEQLAINGIIVACVGNSIWQVIKKNQQQFEESEYPGFIFVPLV